jgi:hypothetical protein
MTIAAKQLLSSFDSLPDADKHQVAVEILRRVSSSSHDLSDDALIAAAEELFGALDADEAKNAQP